MSEAEHRRGHVSSGDVRIHYRAFGRRGATPVVIVHGLSYFSYDWIDVAARLAVDREVVAIDQRGFGESDWSAGRDYALERQVGDVIAVLDHFGWREAVLMGHSMGGRICLTTAAWNRERVAALVSIDFAPDLAAAGRRKVAEQIGRQPDRFASVEEAMAYHGYDGAPGSPIHKRFAEFLKPVAGGFALKRDLHYRDQFRHVLETGKPHPQGIDAWALLAEIRCPLLVIRASRSELFAPETIDKVRRINGRAQIAEIDGGHDLARDNPAALTACVETFLQRSDAAATHSP